MNSPLPQHPLGSLADILQCNCYVRFTSTADIVATQTDVCFVPEADIWPGVFWLGLFDHLIGALLHLQRHIEAQSLRGLEVDHQLVFGRRLHWQVTGFSPLSLQFSQILGRQPYSIVRRSIRYR